MRFCSGALGLAGSLALLGGCGGIQQPLPGPLAGAAQGTSTRPPVSGDLLYVAHARNIYETHTSVSIFSLPQGKPVARISLGELSGMCSDTAGNVWLVVYRSSLKAFYAEKYAHGGAEPIARIRISKYYVSGCAVDPSSGDLAVMSSAGGSQGNGSVDVWTGARPGEPAVHDVPFTPKNGAYDDAGNLFVDGCGCADSDPWLLFGELLKGRHAVTTVGIDKKTALPGGVQWDGQYIAVQTGGHLRRLMGRPRVYRLEVSAGSAHVVGVVIPKNPALSSTAWFAVSGSSIVSTSGAHSSEVDIWPYPAGGPHTRIIGSFGDIRGLTVSVGH
jgi:hypothetical protein